MAGPAGKLALCVMDSLLRRVVLPLLVLAAVLLRYNMFSFVYLLLFMVGVVIPSPRLKAHRVGSIVYLAILAAASLLFLLAQCFFQISLVSSLDFSLIPCEGEEPVLRQLGLVQFNTTYIVAIDIVRLLLPDLVVFAASAVTLGVVAKVFALHGQSSQRKNPSQATPSERGYPSIEQGEAAVADDTTPTSTASPTETTNLAAPQPPPPSSSSTIHGVQGFLMFPRWTVPIFDLAIFALVWLAGVALPSVTSFFYFALFLVLMLSWSLHLTIVGVTRILRTLALVYSSLHFLLLYLYQFQSFQEEVPTQPYDTTDSLLARLFGLSPLIFTNCTQPNELLLWSDIDYSSAVNPFALLCLYWLLATEWRLYITTPRTLWNTYHAYFLPTLDHTSGSVGVAKKGRLPQHYGATEALARTDISPETDSGLSSPDPAEPSNIEQSLHRLWEQARHYILQFWWLLMEINYVFSLTAMMIWSVVYPSWPALVLLLWAGIVWLVPRTNPKRLFFYTSPVLVIYSVLLVLLQYVLSLNLTDSELPWYGDVEVECRGNKSANMAVSDPLVQQHACRVLALWIKSLLMLTFCMTLHQLVKEVKEMHARRGTRQEEIRELEQGEKGRDEHQLIGLAVEGEEVDTHPTGVAVILYRDLLLVMRTYWVLAVVGAFLLVILVGEPSVLKSVYLLFLFIFFIFYQMFRKWWPYINYPLWWLMIVYAFVHLVLVYTYQFDVVSEGYNNTNLRLAGLSPEEVLASIGLVKYSETNELQSLFAVLVPPTIFIAVMALQLRYFTRRVEEKAGEDSFQSSVGFNRVVSQLVQQLVPIGEVTRKMEPALDVTSEAAAKRRSSFAELEVDEAKGDDGYTTPTQELTTYRVVLYVLVKVRMGVVFLWHLMWQFAYVHTHKLVVVSMLALALYEISALYFILVVLLLLTMPIPFLNFFTYPLITIYLGMLAMAKFFYQLKVVQAGTEGFSFNNDDSLMCNDSNTTNVTGTVYPKANSQLSNDSNWVGLMADPDSSAGYIVGPILVALLLCFWYSARRHQAHYCASHDITIERWEAGSLFLGVTPEKANKSIRSVCQYLINHFFEMYGVEVCWIMLAVVIAVRIDVYGPIYAALLGLLLLLPRKILPPFWLAFIILHGCLIALQYLALLGVPPSVVNEYGYPWESWAQGYIRWLFLPYECELMLNKNLLYADVISYIFLCQQMINFARNPLHYLPDGKAHGGFGAVTKIYALKYSLDFLKVIIFQYGFWVTLFMVFVTAATRLSIIGFVYLLICFIFLYRGQDLLTSPRLTRLTWWTRLRWLIWSFITFRSALQVVGCTLNSIEPKNLTRYEDARCTVIGLFNIRCVQATYYGVSDEVIQCDNGSEAFIGLWLDILTFAFVVLQIVILDTRYSDQVRQRIVDVEETGENFKEIMDRTLKAKFEKAAEESRRQLEELNERASKLKERSEKRIDYILHVGVRIPEGYYVAPYRRTRLGVFSESSFDEVERDPAHGPKGSPTHGLSPPDSPVRSKPQASSDGAGLEATSEPGPLKSEVSKFTAAGQFLLGVWRETVDMVIGWLEESSADYLHVVKELRRSQYQSVQEVIVSQRLSGEMRPLTEAPLDSGGVASYGATATDLTATKKRSSSPPPPGQPDTADMAPFDRSGDTLIAALRVPPTELEEQQAEEVESQLEEVSRKYTKRPMRFLRAAYYWMLSHFEYVVFFFIVLAIVETGTVSGYIYAAILFLWGLLSIPWPSRRFWMTLMFYTMLVLLVKYVYLFLLVTFFSKDNTESIVWIFGLQQGQSYFSNAIFNMLLLMTLIFHRSLLKQYGLWKTTNLLVETENIFKQTFRNIKTFFVQVCDPELVTGPKDYYIPMVVFDALCFLTIVFGYSSFSVSTASDQAVTQVAEFIQTNNVPLPFLAMLFLQFISMVIDRAVYLRHSLRAKLIYYVVLLVAWHLWLFIAIPAITERPFVTNTAAQVVYFFKCGYFVMSALQMQAGYPAHVLGYFVAKSYSTVAGFIFLGYRLIPLLPELREIMDWMFTDTSLSIFSWLRLREIWALVYSVKVRREREKGSPRDLGEPASVLIKLLLGGSLVAGLVLLIWGPLLVVSLVNQTGVPNNPVGASMQLNLGGQQLLEITVQEQYITALSDDEYSDIANLVQEPTVKRDFSALFLKENFRRIQFPGNSSTIWTISPPSRQNLANILNDTEAPVELQFIWTLRRNPSTGLVAETITGSKSSSLSDTAIIQFENILNQTELTSVDLYGLYPLFVYAPSNDASTNFTDLSKFTSVRSVNCTAFLNSTSNEGNSSSFVEWWTLIPLDDPGLYANDAESQELYMYVYSEQVIPPIFSTISGIGIIGLYTAVVLVIGKFVRSYVNSLPAELLVDGIINPNPLLELCDDINVARDARNFVLEEILVGKLFAVFRSPEKLLALTNEREN